MPPVIRIGMRWLLAILGCVASFAFGAGGWVEGVEDRLDVQCDSILVNAQKYDALELRCAELQAVYWEQCSRIDLLEEQFNRSGDILEALYQHETGEEWQP